MAAAAGIVSDRARIFLEDWMATRTHWSHGASAAALAFAGLASGCFAGSDSSSGSGSGTAPYESSGTGGSPSSGQPMLVVVDTGETFQASSMAGGQGVGVFVEYQAGGHWSVQWTCDTAITNLNCQFQISVSVTGAGATTNDGAAPTAITDVESQLQSANGQVVQPNASELTATTTTYTAVDGVTFDTAPGATITLNALVNGDDNGAFLFFVQDGKVNGGYTGMLSDPLMFEPSTP
jgi:hypothetical protein